MTPKKIFRDRPDIEKAVYEKFPKKKSENKCDIEKRTMESLRWNLAKKLYNNPETITNETSSIP